MLLCSILLLGPVPAWVHVVDCDCSSDHHAHAIHSDSGCCSASCLPDRDLAEHDLAEHDLTERVNNDTDTPAKGHVPESCSICQSLVSVSGGLCVDQDFVAVDHLCEPATFFHRQSVETSFNAIACPRGPPSSRPSLAA